MEKETIWVRCLAMVNRKRLAVTADIKSVGLRQEYGRSAGYGLMAERIG